MLFSLLTLPRALRSLHGDGTPTGLGPCRTNARVSLAPGSGASAGTRGASRASGEERRGQVENNVRHIPALLNKFGCRTEEPVVACAASRAAKTRGIF